MEWFRKKTKEELNKQQKKAEEAIGASFVVSEDENLEDVKILQRQHPRQYEIYLDSLRKLSKESPEQLPTQFLDEATYLGLLNNLDEYMKSDDFSDVLRGHQQNVIQAVKNFLEKGLSEGYIDMPTGSGKTAIFSKLIKALTGCSDQPKKLKSLILVPGKDLASQTIGYNYNQQDIENLVKDADSLEDIFNTSEQELLTLNNNYRQKFQQLEKEENGGLAKFADNIRALELHCSIETTEKLSEEYLKIKENGDYDTLVITYKSLVEFVKQGVLSEDDFGLIVCDEAHRAMGPATSEALASLNALKIGVTASTESRDKHVSDVFNNEIFKMSLSEAINEGIVMSPKLINHYSQKVIEMKVGSNGDYTEASQESLINLSDRNEIAVSYAKENIEKGLQGIISCVPGDNMEHPKLLAELINNLDVLDSLSGEIRKGRAVCVGGEMDSQTRQAVYSLLETGKIDVITFVDVLKEGWDSNAAKFLINLRPTRSKITAIQRLGRILRFPKDRDTKVEPVAIDILDDIKEQGYFKNEIEETITASDILKEAYLHKNLEDNIKVESRGVKRNESQERLFNNVLFMRPKSLKSKIKIAPERLKDALDSLQGSEHHCNEQGLEYFNPREVVKVYKDNLLKKLKDNNKKWLTLNSFANFAEFDKAYLSAFKGLYDYYYQKMLNKDSVRFAKPLSINQKTKETTYDVYVMTEVLRAVLNKPILLAENKLIPKH